MEKIGGIIFALIIAGGLTAWQYSKKGESSVEYRDAMISVYASACNDQVEIDYVTGVITFVHERAFEDAYRTGSRRTSSSMDDYAYAESLQQAVAAQLTKDKQPDLLERCTAVYEDFMSFDPNG